MKKFIRVINKDLFLLNKELLGLGHAQLWIGNRAVGPKDNNDERVLKERLKEQAKQNKKGWRISGVEAVDLTESRKYPGWFEVDTKKWLPDKYRFNIHSRAYIQAPKGTPLRPIRDGQYSWGMIKDGELKNVPDDQKNFLYLDNNNAGYCFRIEITKGRVIKPAGNGREWIPKWSKIKKSVNKHYQKKLKLAKQT